MVNRSPLAWFKQRYKRRWMTWLDKRIPPNESVQMSLNSIFILPTGFGWSFIVMAFCLFLLGTNYQNNLMLLLCYLMLSIMLLALFYSHQNFARLALKAQHIQGFHCHEQGEFPVQVVAHNEHPGKCCYGTLQISWLLSTSHAPNAKKIYYEFPLNGDVSASSAQRDTLDIPLSIAHRGKYCLPRLTIACDFPLGLFKCWTHLDFKAWVTVYPEPLEGRVNVAQQEADGEQSSLAPSLSGTADFYALTDYEVGQPLNRVAWKHVAKNGSWVIKQFTTSLSDNHIVSVPPSFNVEEAVSILTHQVLLLHGQQKNYGIKYRSIDIPPSNGRAHLLACLEALAVVENRNSAETPHIVRGSTSAYRSTVNVDGDTVSQSDLPHRVQ